MSLKRSTELEITITPEELASEFCEMDNHQQAKFFNMVSAITSDWDMSFCFQLQGVIDSPDMKPEGLDIMRQFGEYAEVKGA